MCVYMSYCQMRKFTSSSYVKKGPLTRGCLNNFSYFWWPPLLPFAVLHLYLSLSPLYHLPRFSIITIIGITIFPLLQNQREDADFTIYHSEIPQGLLYFYATFEKINIRLINFCMLQMSPACGVQIQLYIYSLIRVHTYTGGLMTIHNIV